LSVYINFSTATPGYEENFEGWRQEYTECFLNFKRVSTVGEVIPEFLMSRPPLSRSHTDTYGFGNANPELVISRITADIVQHL
jgi:hypothetical protein